MDFLDDETEIVESTYYINDERSIKDLKTLTLSGYKRTDVKKKLTENIYKVNIEESCYWSAELLCAGHVMDLWELFIGYLGKHIGMANIKLPIYLEKRYCVFRNILAKDSYNSEIELRNNPTIRNLFAEIVCVLALSPKKLSLQKLKINKEEDYDIINIQDRLKAPNTNYSEHIFKEEDSKELNIPINELSYCLLNEKGESDLNGACYWIEWIITFDKICKKKKRKLSIQFRDMIPVEYKYKNEPIWIIWDTLFYQVKEDKLLLKIMNSLLNLFCINFSITSITKRECLLYIAVSLITEQYRRDVDIISNKDVIVHTTNNLHNIYKQIKKKEKIGKMHYLFEGLHGTF